MIGAGSEHHALTKPFAAYRGALPYYFVCYAHRDAEAVYEDLVALKAQDFRFWYDEGIPAGRAWRGEIAGAIKQAHQFLFYVSSHSLQSKHCLREVDYALDHDIEIIPVYLENCQLPAELELALNRVQALFRNEDPRYLDHLQAALGEEEFEAAPVRRRLGRRAGWATVAVVSLLLPLGYWLAQEAPTVVADPLQSSSLEPNAFDHYLSGLDLVERWDRGDNLQRAIDAFTDATLANPDFALAYARLGDAQRMQYALGGDSSVLQTAMGHVQQAVRLNPDLAPVQTALGRIYYTQGNHDLAFAAIERALAIDPNDAGANQSIGSLYERQGRPEDAEAAFRKAVALDSDNPLPLDALANFLYRQGRYDEAIAQWQTLLRMAPDHYGALVNLGSAFSESGRMAEAITLFESAIEIRPNYMAYSNLGTALGRVGRLQEAEQAYLQAVAQPEADWLAWGNLGFIYSRMEDGDEQAGEAFERAIQLAEAARRQSPRDPYLFSDLALYSAKTGSDDVARQHIATALSLAAESGEIQALAASVFAILNDQPRAAEHYNEALALGYPETLLLADIELDALRDSL